MAILRVSGKLKEDVKVKETETGKQYALVNLEEINKNTGELSTYLLYLKEEQLNKFLRESYVKGMEVEVEGYASQKLSLGKDNKITINNTVFPYKSRELTKDKIKEIKQDKDTKEREPSKEDKLLNNKVISDAKAFNDVDMDR